MRIILSNKRILILMIVIILIATGIAFTFKRGSLVKNTEKELNKENINQNNLIDITEVPFDKLSEDNLGVYYNNNKNRVVFKGNQIDNLIFSPSKDKIGFLNNEGVNNKNIPYERQILLYAGKVNTRDFKEIFHGSFRTSGWEWFNNDEIIVYYNCGTECQLLYLINVNSGEGNSLIYGVGYEWSPDKELVLAYHYSWKYGITVGDKKNNIFLTIERKHTINEDDELIDKTKAIWSPDSSKLALVIKKENQNQMELIIFNASDNFKQIFNQDMVDTNDYNLKWSENSKSLSFNNLNVSI